MSTALPYIPDNAPFTKEQRAWLNGYFAGLFATPGMATGGATGVNAGAPGAAGALASATATVTIVYGSQTGNAESVARDLGRQAKAKGLLAKVQDLSGYRVPQLAGDSTVLLVCSTHGTGEFPDNAKTFWEELQGAELKLSQLRFAVLALGDKNYVDFCAAGKLLDARLAALGATRLLPCVECDRDFHETATKWRADLLPLLLAAPAAPAGAPAVPPNAATTAAASPVVAVAAPGTAIADAGGAALPTGTTLVRRPPGVPLYGAKNPFAAVLKTNRLLNGPGSAKDTRHVEISLVGSDLQYEPGDALAVMPRNCTELVAELLEQAGATGREAVPGRHGEPVPLKKALRDVYEISTLSTGLIEAAATKLGAEDGLTLLNGKAAKGLASYLRGRDVVDFLQEYPELKLTPAELVAALKQLQPRYYSISSSPRLHPGEVHLTVGVVRYEAHGRARKGVCSTFLADRLEQSHAVPVYISTNQHFRLPTDSQTPIIMIGPGTGIAPFRAFIEERQAQQASGPAWLFFGDRQQSVDFLYREELSALQSSGALTRLDTAFSRDGAQKVYVQHRLIEHGREVYEWLQKGSHLYVCGDAANMAKDVEAALLQVGSEHGGMSPAAAAAWLQQLRQSKRYQRDVY